MRWLAAATGELSLLVVAGVDVVHQLCKAGVRGSIPLVSTPNNPSSRATLSLVLPLGFARVVLQSRRKVGGSPESSQNALVVAVRSVGVPVERGGRLLVSHDSLDDVHRHPVRETGNQQCSNRSNATG